MRQAWKWRLKRVRGNQTEREVGGIFLSVRQRAQHSMLSKPTAVLSSVLSSSTEANSVLPVMAKDEQEHMRSGQRNPQRRKVSSLSRFRSRRTSRNTMIWGDEGERSLVLHGHRYRRGEDKPLAASRNAPMVKSSR